MTSSTRAFSILAVALAVACPGAFAQKGGGAAGAGMSNMADTGPANPRANSTAEQQAVNAMDAVFADATTNADQATQAIADFVGKYPKSDFVYHANRLGVAFFSNPRHADAGRVAAYAQRALKLLPDDMFTLITAGEAVPRFETADDANLAVNLGLADQWNNKLLSVARSMPGGNARLPAAKPDSAQEKAETAREKKVQIEYNAFIGLARSATLRRAYPLAQQDYEKALTMADFKPEGADLVRAETYLFLAQAQEQAGQWAAAADALDQAGKLDSGSPALQKLVGDELAKVKAGSQP